VYMYGVYMENKIDDLLVVIKRMQSGGMLKLAGKYLGPYKIKRILKHDRYIVEKIQILY